VHGWRRGNKVKFWGNNKNKVKEVTYEVREAGLGHCEARESALDTRTSQQEYFHFTLSLVVKN
jgi:hypothetical protein